MKPIDHSPRAAARTAARKGRETYQASAPEDNSLARPRPMPGDYLDDGVTRYCPVAYDHDYNLDKCQVCGWENDLP